MQYFSGRNIMFSVRIILFSAFSLKNTDLDMEIYIIDPSKLFKKKKYIKYLHFVFPFRHGSSSENTQHLHPTSPPLPQNHLTFSHSIKHLTPIPFNPPFPNLFHPLPFFFSFSQTSPKFKSQPHLLQFPHFFSTLQLFLQQPLPLSFRTFWNLVEPCSR